MAISVVMPALEMAQDTGKLVSWRKKEGEAVAKGEILLEVETDKAVVEVEAQAAGVLGGVKAQPGDVVPVGHTIAWLLGPGESVPAGDAPTQAAADAARPAAAVFCRSRKQRKPPRRRLRRMDARFASLPKRAGSPRRTTSTSPRCAAPGPDGEILAADIMAAR